MQVWTSAAGVGSRLEEALAVAASSLREDLGTVSPDLVFAFVSPHFAEDLGCLPAAVRRAVGGGLLLGCSAGGVIGGGRELESQPAVSLTAAVLPDVDVVPFHLPTGAVSADTSSIEDWQNLIGVQASQNPHFVLLPDPFTFDTERLLAGLDATYPSAKIVGGLASGGSSPGGNALYLGGSVYRAGLVGVALSGNIEIDTVVAQGCKPVGQPMFVTRCSEDILVELDSRTPIDILRDLYAALDASDQQRFRDSLFLGIVTDPSQDTYRQGDFLIRNIVGIDEDVGALAVATRLHPGQVVQFHLRDRRTSVEDLEELLSRYAQSSQNGRPEGALLFSCLGRGEHLYGRSNHDSQALIRHTGEIPIGGFFCNGEIGDVQGRTFVHGYTSAFGLFRSCLRT